MKRWLVVLVVLGLTACGESSPSDDAVATTAARTSTTLSATSTTLGGFANTAVSTPESSPPALLADVQLGSHDGFERIVFRFGRFDTTPGHSVAHAAGPFTQDGSGEAVAVAGNGHIAVRLTAAAHNEQGHATYTGPQRIPGRGSVTEVVMLGDFEGVVGWVIGTTSERPFRVFTLADPARLVIDVASP